MSSQDCPIKSKRDITLDIERFNPAFCLFEHSKMLVGKWFFRFYPSWAGFLTPDVKCPEQFSHFFSLFNFTEKTKKSSSSSRLPCYPTKPLEIILMNRDTNRDR